MPNTLIAWAVAAALVVGLLLFQHYEIQHLDTELAGLKTLNTQLTQANQAFAKQVSDQNASIASLQEVARAQALRAASAVAVAEKQAGVWKHQADQLLKLKPTGDECADAKRVVQAYIQETSK